MPNFARLDQRRGLTPWLIPSHADYVAGQYGMLMALSPSKAKLYIADYERAEKADDEAYEGQREVMRNTQVAIGQPPSDLPPREKIDWNPVERFAQMIAEKKAEEKAAKDAEKKAKKEAEDKAKGEAEEKAEEKEEKKGKDAK